jgi:DNA-binding NarL/FixJ family response regulator
MVMTTTPPDDAAALERRALLIDDHPLFQQTLGSLLRSLEPTLRISNALTLKETTSLLAQEWFGPQDLIFLDLSLDDANGLDAVKAVGAMAPSAGIIVVSGRDEIHRMREAVELGVRGFIPKRLEVDQLISAMRSVLAAGFWFPPEVAQPLATKETWAPRQRQIIAAVAAGKTNKQIGRELRLSETTVKWHVRKMIQKFDLPNRVRLVDKARHDGVID